MFDDEGRSRKILLFDFNEIMPRFKVGKFMKKLKALKEEKVNSNSKVKTSTTNLQEITQKLKDIEREVEEKKRILRAKKAQLNRLDFKVSC